MAFSYGPVTGLPLRPVKAMRKTLPASPWPKPPAKKRPDRLPLLALFPEEPAAD